MNEFQLKNKLKKFDSDFDKMVSAVTTRYATALDGSELKHIEEIKAEAKDRYVSKLGAKENRGMPLRVWRDMCITSARTFLLHHVGAQYQVKHRSCNQWGIALPIDVDDTDLVQ